MSAPAAPAADAAVAPKKKGGKMMILIVGVVFAAAGAAKPMFVNVPAMFAGKPKGEKGKHPEGKGAIVPFGDVVVNLVDPRMQRYLRVKIAVLVDGEAEEEVTELVAKHKAAVKSKLIGHISSKEIKDVSGTVGIHRLQRELLERFEDVLFPEGHSQLREVLFEEYVIQ
jgi:flagellar basal body-associated protein FliL